MKKWKQWKKVIGLDGADEALAFSKKRGIKSVKKADFEKKLPLLNNSVDVITSLDVVEHIEKDQELLKEFFRVLKPGGYTIILVPAENFLFKRIVWPLWIRWRGRIWQDTHLSFFDNNKLPELMSGVGFTQVSTHRFILGMLLLVKARKSG